MATWFEGSSILAAEPKRVASDLKNYGKHCAAVLQFMPGIASAELLADDGDTITIKTNEGTMERSRIRLDVSNDRAVIEFDEVYKAGNIKASSHYRHEFVASGARCEHHLSITDMRASGFMGWLLQRFGGRNIGKGILKSYEAYYSDAARSEDP